MDDTGVADAFYTVLSIGIVLLAALAVSGVVLAFAGHGGDVRPADPDGLGEGLYSFYYAVDTSRSDLLSGDPGDIVLERLAAEGVDRAIAFNASTAPASAPEAPGVAMWSGYLYVPADGDYALELGGRGAAWLWMDGNMAGDGGAAALPKRLDLTLSRGYHPLKVKYFYPELRSASCALSWIQDGRMVPVGSFYR